jgi:DNA (cytosine-5)-methyltransferase 1
LTEQRSPEIRLFDDEVVVDNFAGGGGASTGIAKAIGRSPDVAINHDAEALAMHAANHPDTVHLKDDVFHVDPVAALGGKRCGLAWFSPDCTYFSKAKGGQPFRDRNKARRIRGLIGVVLKWMANPLTRPRVVVIENVEEIEDWCPIGPDGRPDMTKRGSSFRRWCARARGYGYHLEYRRLRGCDYGAPTTRQRLFIILRCDGEPIVWPEATHGRHRTLPHRAAAECIDFSLPVPSIFLTPAEAKAWGEHYGVAPPVRPLADNTLRRVARGVFKFVIDHPQPFIVRFNTEKSPGAEFRGQVLSEPLTTLDTSNRFGLVTPFLAPVVHAGDDRIHAVTDPLRTIVASDREFALIAPTLVNTRNGERHGRHGEQEPRVHDIRQPWGTVTAAGSQGALVTAFLAKHYGGDRGNCAGRTATVEDPIGTVTTSDHHTLVTAYLAKHNGGNEATGQELGRSIDTITSRDQKALTTCHLLKLYGTCQDGAPVVDPMPVVTAHGNHIAAVYAFLVKFYGTAIGKSLRLPLDVVTTRERFGLVLVTIAGEEYVMVDIGMRMLTPRELFLAQGFPPDYVIDINVPKQIGRKVKRWVMRPITKKAQTRLCGNSVNPDVAEAIVRANLAPSRRQLWLDEATA